MQKHILKHIRKKNKKYLKNYERKTKVGARHWTSFWSKVVSRKRFNKNIPMGDLPIH
jgi:hypothetical protein